jgi:hypothetical protein
MGCEWTMEIVEAGSEPAPIVKHGSQPPASRPRTPPSPLHPPEGVRLFAARGVFHHHLHAEPRVPAWGCAGGPDAIEQCGPDGRTVVVGIGTQIPHSGIGCIRRDAEPHPWNHRHRRGGPVCPPR